MKRFILLLLLSAFSLSGADYFKKLNYRITLPVKPTAIEKQAAAELKMHLEKIYSKPVTVNGKKVAAVTFQVGGIKSDVPGRFSISFKNNVFTFSGYDTPKGKVTNIGDDCGTFQAVSYFLQKYLGVKFIFPGSDGIKYTRINPAITFAGNCDAPVPSYDVRGFQTAGQGVKNADMIWFFKRRLGRIPFWVRSDVYYSYLNRWPRIVGKRKDLLPFHRGARVASRYPRHFPCTSNPDTLKFTLDYIRKQMSKTKNVRTIRFFSDAPVAMCQCPDCRNSKIGKIVQKSNSSELVYSHFAQIGNALQKDNPNLHFYIQTKGSSYSTPPVTEKLPRNTTVGVLVGHFQKSDPTPGKNLCALWQKAGARTLVYGYSRSPEMKNLPVMNVHRIADFLKQYHGSAAGSLVSEGRRNVRYGFSALNNYVHSAVIFDVKADTDALIDEFCRLAAPAARKELKEFYRQMEMLIGLCGFREDPRFACYSRDNLKAPRRLLDQALKKEPNNKFLKQLSTDFAWLEGIIDKAATAFAAQMEILKKYNSMAAVRNNMKLTEGKKYELPFIPFSAMEKFNTARAAISLKKGSLFIRVVCAEPDLQSLRTGSKKNFIEQIWEDDVVEIFIGRDKGKQEPFLHAGVTAANFHTVRSHSGGKAVTLDKFPIVTRTGKNKDSWFAEVEIPLSALKDFIVDNSLQLGIARHRPYRRKGRKSESTQLSVIQRGPRGSFADPNCRITVRFDR